MNRFSLELNAKDWVKLDRVAVAMGYENSRAMINARIKMLAENEDLLKDCPGGRNKIKNNYLIPPELKLFYGNLCCTYSENASKILLRFVILPVLDMEIREDTPVMQLSAPGS